jgi:hypothetical protein
MHPRGTVDELVADVGREFRREYAVVLRGVFYGGDRDGPQPADDTDCVERRARFEAEYPETVIVTPPTLRDLWRATVPAGQAADRDLGMQITAWSLCDLMDKLDDICPPDVTTSES